MVITANSSRLIASPFLASLNGAKPSTRKVALAASEIPTRLVMNSSSAPLADLPTLFDGHWCQLAEPLVGEIKQHACSGGWRTALVPPQADEPLIFGGASKRAEIQAAIVDQIDFRGRHTPTLAVHESPASVRRQFPLPQHSTTQASRSKPEGVARRLFSTPGGQSAVRREMLCSSLTLAVSGFAMRQAWIR